ncbi:hypothetical protein HYFRA_00013822 [Hymenoscyphus fraxineus]|uniref:SGNH hydrolase-type esterase domain-containing protein n=1 Tax=Hymenoscyphus fraxineus TaxID=746836 RepID=A0A9N9L702_9HELO|nr:hypothetical protein HYFRA_00013822 [Hymenoscyphus fraxineus]
MLSRISHLVILALFLTCFSGIDAKRSKSDKQKWIPTWGSMPQLTEPQNLPPAPFNETDRVFFNSTIRQTIRTSIGGSQIRLRFSNAFGPEDLLISDVTVALSRDGNSGSNVIQRETLRDAMFSGQSSYIVPQGALVVSDPIDFQVAPLAILTVTMYLKRGQWGHSITSHPGSRTTSWIAFGNQVSEAEMGGECLQKVDHWYFLHRSSQSISSHLTEDHRYFLSNVEVFAPRDSKAFIIVGDSITDGRGSEINKNNRWPDLLLNRLQRDDATSNIAIINQAAGGNRILNDGLGPNVLSRLDRDVLSQAGVKYAMIFEGVNDIGTADVDPTTQEGVGNRIISAYEQFATRLEAFDIRLFAGTITPFSAPANFTGQPYSHPEREKTRQRVNKWIRESDVFDEVIDFDKFISDEKVRSQLSDVYDSGDYLHPNVVGYQKLADEFPLDSFKR